jgi:4'-phosphopantetheinyl transferase
MVVAPSLGIASQQAFSDQNVHVWAMPIRAQEPVVSKLEILLSPDERMRGTRFRFDHLRRSFILTRGALRLLLGRYLDIAPSEIQIQYGPARKPFVASPANIQFNVSHSGDMALYAFSTGGELGVDVERIRPLPDMLDIASHFFCQEEFRELSSLPAEQRDLSFFLCWTRKEAYTKALGGGLRLPMSHFCVTVRPEQPARLLHIGNDEAEAKEWTLHDLMAGSPYAAALAYRGAPRPMRMWSLSDLSDLLEIRGTNSRG